MKTTIANGHSLLMAASLLPLLMLTACAGSQRLVASPQGGQQAYGQSGYGEPVLQPAPPISSAPVTSEPLPPPGGYPTASAGAGQGGFGQGGQSVAGQGALPAPGDPFYEPNAGAPRQGGQPAPEQPPTLRGGGGQIATLGAGAGSTRGAVTSRDGVIGSWTAREATGGSCRVQLTSAPSLDLYRANASGCSNRDLQTVNAWDFRNGEVYLYQQGGTVVARLRASDGGAMNGAVTKSGAALSLSR